jgi:hypothetical protein
METATSPIMKKLEEIQSELHFIKNHMVDKDALLSSEDKAAMEKANEELKKGQTTSLKDLKKELNL